MVANSTESPTLKDSALPSMPKSGPHRKRIGLISIVACFGGLLFGYDTGVINGALRPMSEELGLTAVSEGVVTSSLVFAAALEVHRAQRVAVGGVPRLVPLRLRQR